MAYVRTWKGGVILSFLMITNQVALVVKNLPANRGDTRDGSIHGIFQARVLEWGAIAFSTCMRET